MNSFEPDDHRADGAGQTLRQAERHGIGRFGQLSGGQAKRDHGVEEARAVDVEGDAVGVGDVGHGPRVVEAERLAHRMGVRVLEGDQAGDRLVRVGRVAEGVLELVQVEGAVGVLAHLPDRGPDDDGMAGLLVFDDVGAGPGDRLLAAAQVAQLRDEVAHRAAGDEEGRLLAEQLGRPLLEGVDGGVVAEDVVAELGLVHGLAHGRRGVGDGVAAEVDHSVSASSAGLSVEYRSLPTAGRSGRVRAKCALPGVHW